MKTYQGTFKLLVVKERIRKVGLSSFGTLPYGILTIGVVVRFGPSHLFVNDVVQVWDADVGFDQGDLVHLLREGPLLDSVANPHVIVRRWAALRDKHLL